MIESESYILEESCTAASPHDYCLLRKFQIKERLSLVEIKGAYGFKSIKKNPGKPPTVSVNCFGCGGEGTGKLIFEEMETK